MDRNEIISAFLGLNKRDVISQGELAATKNCSARRYPLLAPRSPRDYISTEVPDVTSCTVNGALYFSITRKNTYNKWVTSLYKVIDDEVIITFSLSGPQKWYYHLNNSRIEGGSWSVDMTDGSLKLYDCGILDVNKAEWAVHESTTWNEAENYEFYWDYTNNIPDFVRFTSSDIFDPTADVRLSCRFAEKIHTWRNGAHDYDVVSPYGEDITMVNMGAYILIFPAGFFYNTQDGGVGNIYLNNYNFGGYNTYILPTDIEGHALDAYVDTSPPPTISSFPSWWIDTSGRNAGRDDLLKVKEYAGDSYHEVAADYVCIRTTNSSLLSGFHEGDNLKINITSLSTGSYDLPETNYILKKLDSIYNSNLKGIIVNGKVHQGSNYATFYLTRTFPRMDYVCECDNRLWGVAKDTNEIYACALGNFFNWSYYQGISTDPWTVSRGCPGEWTGCVNYLGTPTFFKQNYIECVYPSSSGAHQTSTLHINGTGPISPRSIAMVDNIVYYLGTTGFYAYSGSLPRKISQALAENYYTDGVAGDLSGFYYVSCKDKDMASHLFVYDTENRLWYEEDDFYASCMVRKDSKLYVFGYQFGLFTTSGGDEIVEWEAVTGDFIYNRTSRNGLTPSYDDSYPREFDIRYSGGEDEHIDVFIEYDGGERWTKVATLVGKGKHRYTDYPIVPERCDYYRLKFIGHGDCAIWSINIIYYTGGKTK